MASCEHLQRTSMYFDGELAPADEREAADHLATCAECQALLGDAVALDAALSGAKAAASTRVVPRRRWQIAIGAATLVAAAAIAILVLRPKPHDDKPEHVALVLPAKRSLEVRFSGAAVGAYRPYEPPRDRAHEAIDVRALAELEQRGETRDLVGALASTGELVRAADVARKTPADAAALSDLAAIALASGDPEGALDFAYAALAKQPDLAAARWNLGLAARKLQLWRVSRAAFTAVAARAERGWGVEAEQHAALLDRELHRGEDIAKLHAQFKLLVTAGSVRNTITDPSLRDNIEEFQRRSRSILEDETPIELTEVRRLPSHALQFLYESLASATPGVIEGLEPVATALDKQSNTTIASDLIKAGGKREDPFAGIASHAGPDLPEACKLDLFALPCAPLAWKVARQQLDAGRADEALRIAELGRDVALRAYLPVDYQLLAELHRRAKRNALATADSEEAALAAR